MCLYFLVLREGRISFPWFEFAEISSTVSGRGYDRTQIQYAHVSSCVHIYIHIYACVCMCMYAYVCVCMCMYVYVCVCMCMYVYVCLCMSMYVYVCLCICMYVCMYVCMQEYICIQTKYIDTYTCTNKHNSILSTHN